MMRSRMNASWLWGLMLIIIVSTNSCIAPESTGESPRPNAGTDKTATSPNQATNSPTAFLAPVDDQKNLQNAHYVIAKVISGAQPEGEDSFKALQKLGVKTIISVDGAKPDVASAKKYGITYVHLPITYSGVTPEEGKAIAKALEELPGPIYVHCHHGKHRSAAAVAVACVYNGSLAPDQAETVLQTFGTGENYKGLWKAAREAKPLSPAELRNFNVKFVESKDIAPLAKTMVTVDEQWDHIKAIQKAGWQSPKDHPDLDPPHEALQLAELFREIPRTDASRAKSPEFIRLTKEAVEGSESLRQALSTNATNSATAEIAFKRVAISCSACHKAFRD